MQNAMNIFFSYIPQAEEVIVGIRANTEFDWHLATVGWKLDNGSQKIIFI